MKQLTYSETFDVIARYANESLELFADGWSRFPSQPICYQLIKRLEQANGLFSRVGDVEAVEQITKAILTLNERSK